MKAYVRWATLFALGVIGVFVVRGLLVWREDVRVERLVRDTLQHNPQSNDNEQLMARMGEQVWPEQVDQQVSIEGSDREVVPAIVAQEADADWNSLERTGWKLEEGIEDLASLAARSMFRSRQLNPGDIYIEQGERDRFAQSVKVQVERVRQLMAALDAIASQEFGFMEQRGNVHSLSFADYEKTLDDSAKARVAKRKDEARRRMLESGIDEGAVNKAMESYVCYDPATVGVGAFQLRTGDGKFSWALLKEMPQAKQAAEMYSTAVLDLCYRVLEFFTQRAGLGSVDAEQVVAAVEAHLARFRP
jgi:hypothetical protein